MIVVDACTKIIVHACSMLTCTKIIIHACIIIIGHVPRPTGLVFGEIEDEGSTERAPRKAGGGRFGGSPMVSRQNEDQ